MCGALCAQVHWAAWWIALRQRLPVEWSRGFEETYPSQTVVVGGPFNFGYFFVSFFACFLFFVASGFCGFWLLWLLAFVAFVASVAFGFCGFWLFGLSIYLSISTFFLSFLAAVLLSLFAFAFPVVFVAETKPNKEASKQGSKHELLTFGSGAPPPTPPRHEICTSSPTPALATKSIF